LANGTEGEKGGADLFGKPAEGFWARLNHPVFGSFFTSVIVWNWEAFYFLIRGLGKTEETVVYVRQCYFNMGNLYNLVVVPALLTLIFLALAPGLFEAYVLWRKWWSAFAEKFKPIFNFVYKANSAKYENDIRVMKSKFENEKKARVVDEEKNKEIQEKQKNDYDRLSAKYEMSKRNVVHVPGHGNYEPGAVVDQFINLNAKVGILETENRKISENLRSKNAEVERLKRRIAELEA
jgi:hypothetical protein